MNKRNFFTWAIVLAMALLIFPFFSVKEVHAKQTEKISKESVTMYTNESSRIKIKNASFKVSWYSSNEKIVKIYRTSGKKNHVVSIGTGNKTGKCTIKAKVNGKVYKCKVTVKEGKIYKKYNGKTSKLSVVKINLSKSDLSVRVKMSNASKKDIYYGNGFLVQKYEDGKWETLEAKDGYAFTCVAYNIPSKTSVSKTLELSTYYDRSLFTAGKYRIHVDCECSNEYVEFSIK